MDVFETINSYRVRFANHWEHMKFWQNLGVSLLFVSLITLGAKIRIYLPFTPVPFTLQTFFIMTASLYLREKWASLSTGIYLLLGLVGIPVFAGDSSGVSYFFGSTGGYLIAFLIVPPIISHLFRRYGYTWKSAFAASFMGSMLILAIGSIYLGIYIGNLAQGIIQGFLLFLGVELFKALGSAGAAKILFPGVLKT